MTPSPRPEEVRRAAASVVDRLLNEAIHLRERPVFPLPDPPGLDALQRQPFLPEGRPLDDVLGQLLDGAYGQIARMNHPRCFAFIPAPTSSLSWLGDLIVAGFNAHGGSWIQSAGPASLEVALLRRLADAAGFPDGAGGVFVSGGSMANLTALTTARDARLTGEERARAVAYVSDQTHSSVAKGMRIIGLGDSQIRTIPSDDGFRMDVAALAARVSEDHAAGLRPWAVVASLGTTNTGAVDPLDAIADLCAAEGLWLHVDGAYGASALLSTHRGVAEGVGRADSLSWDPHKWLFQTYGCGLVLVRDRRLLVDTFHASPEYLRDAVSDDSRPNFWDYGPELTRPTRAVKLWLTLQVLGGTAVAAAIDHGFRLAEWAEDEVRRHPDWEVVSPASLGIVTFRCAPSGVPVDGQDRLNAEVSRLTLADGFAGVLTTRLRGRTVLRICAIHPDATEIDMRATIGRLDGFARALLARG